MRFTTLFISLLFTFNLPAYSQEETAETLHEAVIFPPGISKSIQDIFLARIADGKPMSLPQAKQTLEDSPLADVWKGNRPYMKSAVSGVKLEFTKNAGDLPEKFNFQIEFNNDSLLIKHSNPFYPSEAGGFILGNDKIGTVKRFLFRGKNNQSLAIMIPGLHPAEKSRGAMICPRDFLSVGTREEKASLQDTGFVLGGAYASVSSEANAYLKNPIDFVLAQAKILVTPGVLKPISFFDQSYSKAADVALTYRPSDQYPQETFPSLTDMAGGVENFISLHFASGFKRVSTQKALVYIKSVDNPKDTQLVLQPKDVIGTEMETELKLRGIVVEKQRLISAKVKPGTCYIVLYQVIPIIHEYFKEEFIVPKGVQQQ